MILQNKEQHSEQMIVERVIFTSNYLANRHIIESSMSECWIDPTTGYTYSLKSLLENGWKITNVTVSTVTATDHTILILERKN